MLGAGGAALESSEVRAQMKQRRSAVQNWWRKWSYEIPLAFGDALWEVLVVQFADFLSRLTVRRVLEFVAIALLVMAFAQTAPIDLAFLFAGDTLMYLEFVVIVRLAAGREHFWHVLHLAARFARLAMRVAKTAIDRTMTAINRRRERRSPARPAKPRLSDPSDDNTGFGAAWGALATA
jgi:hypothetical protein